MNQPAADPAEGPLPFNAEVASLVGRESLNDLGPGRPTGEMLARLNKLSPERLVAPHAVRDASMAQACLAGLWLLHDDLDRSHNISQSLGTLEGSYWHGIMHRREPDYDNAKYWFRRAGAHDVHTQLAAAARQLALAAPLDPAAEFLRTETRWDALRFVDLCQAVAQGRSKCGDLCRRIQRREWELLFMFCWRGAGGSDEPSTA